MTTVLYKLPKNYNIYSHNNLNDLSETITKDGVHQIRIGENTIDVLLQGFDEKYEHTALLCFGGAVFNRINKTAPFFSGLNIAKRLNVPLIAIADPTVSAFNMNIAWYAGHAQFLDLQISLSKLIEHLSNKLVLDNLIMFGGSAGGFACLVQAKLLESLNVKVFVWNPQTSITKYFLKHVGNYIEQSFPNYTKNPEVSLRKAYKEILDGSLIINSLHINELSDTTELVYLQNLGDTHTKQHLLPFMNLRKNNWKRAGISSFFLEHPKVSVYIGNWGEGHAVPPNELIYFVLKELIINNSGTQIINDLQNTDLAEGDKPEFIDIWNI